MKSSDYILGVNATSANRSLRVAESRNRSGFLLLRADRVIFVTLPAYFGRLPIFSNFYWPNLPLLYGVLER
jgi:hypothetical protein